MMKWSALVGVLAAVVLAADATSSCEISSSATDREKARREMRKEAAYFRQRAADEAAFAAFERSCQLTRKRFFAPGGFPPQEGCDGCSRLCEPFDLQPMEPAAFTERFRQLVHVLETAAQPERVRANRDMLGLMCVAKKSGKPLLGALQALMDDSSQPRSVRRHAGFRVMIHRLDGDWFDMLRELSDQEGDDSLETFCLLEDRNWWSGMSLERVVYSTARTPTAAPSNRSPRP